MFATSLIRCPNVYRSAWSSYRLINTSSRIQSATLEKELKSDDPKNKPAEYLGSKAAQWKASSSRRGTDTRMPWYQPLIVCASTAAFLIYFCILREENDIDLELTKPLYDRIAGLEEMQLKQVIQYNKENGIPYADAEERLAELAGK